MKFLAATPWLARRRVVVKPVHLGNIRKVKGMKIQEEKRRSIHQYNHPPSKDASINKEAPVKN
jgi:hypothetical protein